MKRQQTQNSYFIQALDSGVFITMGPVESFDQGTFWE
jgi:hypothetical protein